MEYDDGLDAKEAMLNSCSNSACSRPYPPFPEPLEQCCPLLTSPGMMLSTHPSAVVVPKEESVQEFDFFEALSLTPQKEPFTIGTEELLSGPVTVFHPIDPITPKSPPPLATPLPKAASTTNIETPSNSQPTIKNPPKMSRQVSKAHIKCSELCHVVAANGDRTSVRMLEYLTTVKQISTNFDRLAHLFLDTCQILFSIEAGLAECGRSTPELPPDVVVELDKKLRVAQSDFNILDQMLSKLLEYERKGTMGRMRRGWGKIFGDTDVDKMTSVLERTKEGLRMSALLFQWTLGTEKIERGMGIGFTGLAAALDRLDDNSGRVRTKASEPDLSRHRPSPLNQGLLTVDGQHQQMLPSSAAWSERSSSRRPDSSLGNKPFPVSRGPSDDILHHYSMTTPSSIISNERVNSGIVPAFDRASTIGDASSHTGTTESDALLEELAGMELGKSKAVRLKVDPFTMPRWTPRSTGGSDAENLRGSIISAVRGKNHKLIEQLLDRGVSPNAALTEAVNLHDSESIRLLLLFGADPNEADTDGITPLFAAVQKMFFSGAITLLKYGADPNLLAGPELESPLASAIATNKVSLSHLMLMYGGDLSQGTPNGNTLLIASINKKTPKRMIDILLHYGVDPNEKNREGKTALFEAINAGRVDIVGSLLDQGADPNLPGPKHMLWPAAHQTPCLQLLLSHGADYKKCPGIMELATSLNNIEAVRVLLKAGVDPNAKKDGVYTPLCTSIRDNRMDIFQLLLSSGADPNVMASEYPAFKCVTHKRVHLLPALVTAGADLHSPKGILEMAVSTNNMEALSWLLDQGLDPNERNPKGYSPLTTAIRENRMEMIEILLARGADPNKRGQDWPVCMAVRSPPILRRILSVLAEPRAYKGVMEMAVAANQIESVKLLLASGVSVEDKNGGVFSPLTTAIREDMKEMVEFLITDGHADLNAPGEHLPVVKAVRRCRGDDTDILEMLLNKGANPNKVYRGWNAFMQAVENGDMRILRLLSSKFSVDLEARDDQGRNVIDIASSRGWEEAVNILLEGNFRL
ncbi:ankyrin repeat-containing domain protein [Trichoderma velutinum]